MKKEANTTTKTRVSYKDIVDIVLYSFQQSKKKENKANENAITEIATTTATELKEEFKLTDFDIEIATETAKIFGKLKSAKKASEKAEIMDALKKEYLKTLATYNAVNKSLQRMEENRSRKKLKR